MPRNPIYLRSRVSSFTGDRIYNLLISFPNHTRYIRLLMQLQEILGCQVDVVTEKGLRSRIRERVLSEAVPL